MLILVTALLLAGLAFALAIRALLLPRLRTNANVATIGEYGYAAATAPGATDADGVRSVFNDCASFVGGLALRHFGKIKEAELRTELLAAGLYTMPPRRFIGYRILCVVTVPAACVSVAATAGMPTFFSGVLVLLGVVGGWMGPLVLVRKRARRRLEQIEYELPELIDILVVTVEAGLGLSSSLQIASERLGGPLGNELRLMLQEQSLGLPTDEALRNMLTRAETPAMRSFVRSILQGESLGVSIGDIMRTLATEMRKRRRAGAEERAQKAPVKLLFPLIFLIFPAMFVVLLGPSIFQFLEAFGG